MWEKDMVSQLHVLERSFGMLNNTGEKCLKYVSSELYVAFLDVWLR